MGLIVGGGLEPLASTRTAHIAVGGAESNVAIAFSRLGGQATWVSRLGADPIGDLVESQLRSAGIELIAPRIADRPTGLMVKERQTGGERRVTYYRSASAAQTLEPGDVPTSLIEAAHVVHLTGITPALSESTRRTILDVAQRAKSVGTTVSFDVNYRPPLWSRADASVFLREIGPVVDVLFGDPAELELFAPNLGTMEVAHEAVVASPPGPREIVIKRGDRGAIAVSPDSIATTRAYPVAVVDTVGAGDAFVGGYLSALAEGTSLTERLDRAARCGALQCTVLGDWEGTPHRHELDHLGPNRIGAP